MNRHKVIGDSNESAIVDPEIIANRAGSSSSAAAAAEDTLAQVIPRQDRSDESDKWLMIEHVASDTGQARPSKTLDEVIKQTLVRLLRETRGNRRRTASLLGSRARPCIGCSSITISVTSAATRQSPAGPA
jgi:hypothetical protein